MNALNQNHEGIEKVLFVILAFWFFMDDEGNSVELNELFLDILMVFGLG
jgi:hypothetical protein